MIWLISWIDDAKTLTTVNGTKICRLRQHGNTRPDDLSLSVCGWRKAGKCDACMGKKTEMFWSYSFEKLKRYIRMTDRK